EMDNWPDEWLIAASARDLYSHDPVQVLVRRYQPGLRSFCRMLTMNKASAEDLLQEAWIGALKRRQNWNPGKSLYFYISKAATNIWHDTRGIPEAELPILAAAGATIAPPFRSITINDVLMQLSEEERTVLHLRYIEGLTAKEIADL